MSALRKEVGEAVFRTAGHGLIEWREGDVLVLEGHGKEKPDMIIDAVNDADGLEAGWQLEKIETANNAYRLVEF